MTKMATVEKVLTQISERKKSIIERVRHQIRLFDHHLASNCLLAGVNPPPWLLPYVPSEFKREDLISGLLLSYPQPSVPCSSRSHLGLYEQQVVRPVNLQSSDVLGTEVHSLKIGFDVETGPSAVQSRESGRCAPETGVATPADFKDPTASGVNHDSVLSLERLQRSRSRQKYLELRNSVKAAKSHLNDDKNVESCDPNSGRPQVASQQSSHVALGGSELVKSADNIFTFEGEEEKVGKHSSREICDNVLSGRITRSRSSRQQTNYVIEPASGTNLSVLEKKDAVISTGSLSRSKKVDSCNAGSAVPQVASSELGQVGESELVKSADNLQVGKQLSVESCNNVYSGRSSSSRRQINPVNEPTSVDNHTELGKMDDVISISSLVKSKLVDCCDAGMAVPLIASLQTGPVGGSELVKSAGNMIMSEGEKENVGKQSSKRSCTNVYSSRLARSRSSRWQTNSINELASVNHSCDIAKKNVVLAPRSLDKSRQKPTIAVQFLESEQISLLSKEIGEIGVRKVKEKSFQSDEKRSSNACLRITRSRSSSLQNASLNGHLKMGSDRSKQYCDEQSIPLTNHVHDLMESVKIFEVSDTGITNLQLQENLVGQYINGNSGTESTLGVARSLKHTSPSNDPKCEVMQSKYNSSSKSPHEKSLKNSAGIGDQEASGAEENALPYTLCSNMVGPNGRDAIFSNTDADFDQPVKLLSASLKSIWNAIDQPSIATSSNRISGVVLHDIVSSPQCKSAMVVKPKQLDFNDVEECNVGEASSPSFEKEKEVKLPDRGPFTCLESADKWDKISPFQCQEEPNSLVKKKKLAGKEVKPWEDLSVAVIEETCGTSRTSNLNILSSRKEKSVTYTDTFLTTLHESHGIPNSLGKPLKDVVASDLSAMSPNAGVGSHHEGSGQLEKMKLSKLTPEESSLKVNICGRPEISADSDFIRVDGPDLLKKADATPTHCDIDCPVISLDGDKVNSEGQKENLSAVSHSADFCSEGRCDRNEDNVILPSVKATFRENDMAEKHFQFDRSSSSSMELSWPQKRRKINGQQRVAISSSLGSKDEHSLEINVNKSPTDGKHLNLDCCVTDTNSSNPELQGLSRLKDEEGCRNASSVSVSNIGKEVSEDSKSCLGGQNKVADQVINISDSKREHKEEENRMSLQFTDKFEWQNADLVVFNEGKARSQIQWVEGGKFSADPPCIQSMELVDADQAKPEMDLMVCEKSTVGSTIHSMENCKFSTIDPPCRQSVQMVDADHIRPEMEGFVMQTDDERLHFGDGISLHDFEVPRTAIEHSSLLKELCKSSHVDTPLSHFPTMSKLQKTSNLFQSVPNGLLECLDTRLSFHANDYITKQIKLSADWFSGEVGSTSHPRSFSDCLPAPSSQLSWGKKKPCASPVRKLWDRMTLNCSSSGKRSSLKQPELPSISEENEVVDEVVDATKKGIDFEGVTCSVQRKPLAEIKEDSNLLPSMSEAETFNCRNSLESIDMAYSFSVTKNEVKQKVENRQNNIRDQSKLKENQSLQQGANKMARESVRHKLSRQKLSGKMSSMVGGPNFSARESKVNNIVSNVTSFIPLVQPKKTAPVITGKKDVRVKALEAAEVAKRLAEKKQNERNMKKEALKLERARLEQENLKQLELQKKQKEEEQKKKEAYMAEKKRKKEEEERLEKERKRKRIEDVRNLQRELEEKLHAKKDEKEKNDRAPVQSNGGKTKEDEGLLASTIHEQSYDISPYRGSDDEAEEEEEDNVGNTKFIPSWARKKCVALAVASQQNQDPEVIFPIASSCSISQEFIANFEHLASEIFQTS